MKKILIIFCVFNALLAFSKSEVIKFGGFGNITIYQKNEDIKSVVLFASGDGGWNKGVVEMAQKLMEKGALVVGFDTVYYLKSMAKSKSSAYPAGDLESLSKYIQIKYKLTNYFQPILFGYSSGASLVYTALVQAPPNTFKGAVSLGFCPDLAIDKNFNAGYGLKYEKKTINKIKSVLFEPAKTLVNPWYVLQGVLDKDCSFITAENFVNKIENAFIYKLENVGHGFAKESDWIPYFNDAYDKLESLKQASEQPVSDISLKDLPLIEVLDNNSKDYFALILTGDGGWANIDRDIGNYLSSEGIQVVGFNSLKYFWKKRSALETANDIEKIISVYSKKLGKSKVLIIGYSFGADVLPFILNRFSPEMKKLDIKAALLGTSKYAQFEFKVTDWIGGKPDETNKILPEIQKIKDIKLLFINGENETDGIAPILEKDKFDVVILKGGHHFSGDYKELAKLILSKLSF